MATKEDKMNNQGNLKPVTPEMELLPGTLIGFCAKNDGHITASYPVYSKIKNSDRLAFIIGDINPCVDATRVGGEVSSLTAFVNEPPIVLEINGQPLESFSTKLSKLFNP